MAAPSTPLEHVSRPRKPSFIDLFLGTDPNITRSNRGMKMVVPKKTLKHVGSTQATADTAAATMTEPASTPAPAAETPAPPNPEPAAGTAAAAAPPTATEPPAAAEATSMGWTEMEDAVLIGMKTQGKTWKEIQDAMPTKTKRDLKQRLQELSGDVKGKGKEPAVSFAEGNRQSKNEGKKGILKAAGDDSDWTDDEGIDPRGLPKGDVRGKKMKKTGYLKIIEVDSDEEEPVDLRGHPIVYLDPEAGLSEAHMKILYKLTRKNDDVKWLEIASRFYDKTGKRMEPDALKHMLRNL